MTELTWATNTKTGKTGIVIDRYVHTRTGRAMVQVNVLGRMAYWLADHVVVG